MTTSYQTYDAECPRCGYPETRDHGPYEPRPSDAVLGPVDPDVHMMTCGRCGDVFDVGTPAAHQRRAEWTESQHQLGAHQCCDPASCRHVRRKVT
jgi:hypothetical protein